MLADICPLLLALTPGVGSKGHVFMPQKELWEAYSNCTVRPSPLCVRFISPLFFEVGIPNLVCGWRSVAYHFRVTVTLNLTSDLIFRTIVFLETALSLVHISYIL